MEVRTVVAGDGPVLRDVRLRALADAPEAFESNLEKEKALDAAHWERFAATEVRVTFLAERDGEVVGMAGGTLHERDPRSASLIAMWVAPSARGDGTARALADTVAAWASERGALTLGLCVMEDNARARAFYEAAGYAPTGERRSVGNPAVTELLMRRPLP